MITKAALKSGFSGGLVVDFPHSTKAKKIYLVLDAGSSGRQEIIWKEGIQEEDEDEEENEMKSGPNHGSGK